MKTETEFKSIFKKSIRKEGGFALSLAAPMISGIPDLIINLSGYIPCLLEAKFLKEVHPTFKRKINYSALQKENLKECNKANPYTAYGLIGFKWQSEYFAVMTPFHVENIDYTFASKFPHCLYNPKTKLFDVKYLFSHSSIPKLNIYPQCGLEGHLTETKIYANGAV